MIRVKKSDIELESFKNFLFEEGKRPNTVEDYSRHIRNFHQWLITEGSSIHEITRYDIQQGSVAKFKKVYVRLQNTVIV